MCWLRTGELYDNDFIGWPRGIHAIHNLDILVGICYTHKTVSLSRSRESGVWQV